MSSIRISRQLSGITPQGGRLLKATTAATILMGFVANLYGVIRLALQSPSRVSSDTHSTRIPLPERIMRFGFFIPPQKVILSTIDKIEEMCYSFVDPKREYSLNIGPMNRLHRFASYALLGTASALSALYILAGDPALSFEPDRNGYSGENHYVNVCVEKEDVNRCYNDVPYNDPDLIRFTQKYNPEETKRIPWLSDALDNGSLFRITLGGWIGSVLFVYIFNSKKE